MPETDLGGASPPALWDLIVRTSHWGIAGVVFSNEIITRGGSVAHVWVGWIGLGLLAVRLVWGLVGSKAARFSSFPPDPRRAVDHMRALFAGRPGKHPSHNPAGALMVYALWAVLAVLIGTGIMMSGPNPMLAAERAALVNSDDWSKLVVSADGEEGDERKGGDLVKGVHEAMANLILLLVSVHVAGVAVEGFAMQRNLVVPMLFGAGRKKK
jgi:cytochrome b